MDRYGTIPEAVLGRMAVRIVQGLIYMWHLKILHRGWCFINIFQQLSSLGILICKRGLETCFS